MSGLKMNLNKIKKEDKPKIESNHSVFEMVKNQLKFNEELVKQKVSKQIVKQKVSNQIVKQNDLSVENYFCKLSFNYSTINPLSR